MKKSLFLRRIIVFVLILAIVVMTLGACSQKEDPDKKTETAQIVDDSSSVTPVASEDSSETDKDENKKQEDIADDLSENDNGLSDNEKISEAEAPESNTEESDKNYQEVKKESDIKVSDVPQVVHEDDDTEELTGALAFVRKLRLGWNLGNTMDATNSMTTGANLNLESSWSGIKTTPEMIDTIKEAGFKSVRIPVSWHNHVDKDYNIAAPWLARVKTIVDYVISRDMYCIINIHHDNQKEYIYPTTDYLEQSKNYVKRIWEQVGETFKDYDDHLIFESLNEPRLVGTTNEWYLSDNEMCHDAVRCINELNQVFVDTIRSQDGNNADRYLLVPGYAAQWGAATDDEFVIPQDSADNKILIECHAYSPENFCLTAPTESNSTNLFNEFNNGSTSGINQMMFKLKKAFIDKGIGVVIDEFGSRDKDGNTADRANHAGFYVKKAREFGITCFLWDNNLFTGSGERFGLLDRKSNTIRYPEIMQALVENCQ